MATHLIHVPMDMRAFNQWTADRGFVRRGTFDEGYALHVLLSSTFGKGVMQPFRLFWSARRRNASLYAYGDEDGATLREIAEDSATPDCLAALSVTRLRSKTMRTEFSTNQRLGFDIRVRPVRRLHSAAVGPNGRTMNKGAEIDAFVAHVMRETPNQKPTSGSVPRREAVYCDWLAERFGSAVRLDKNECRLASFRRTRAVRGDGPGPEGPDATIHGELTVSTPGQFSHQLRHGLGRHKAFGYGMLLLRPVSARPATGDHQ